MTATFTALTPENCQQAYEIHQGCHLFPWSLSVFKDCLTPPYFTAQLDYNRHVVGYFVGMAVAGEATLMDLGVDQNHRQKGMGQSLLSEFLIQARVNKCEEVWLEVRESNQQAIRLYERNGFAHIECRKNYYPNQSGRENGLIMRASLA